MKTSTARFLELMNKANAQIAAHEAKKEAEREAMGTDPVRVERDAERRERLGQLRAVEHPRSRPHIANPVFGHVDLRA